MHDDGASAIAGDITFTGEEELAAYRTMLLIRRFEEKAGQLYALGAVHGLCPLSIGQEASIAGVVMAASPGDQVITGSRNHGHMLALGVEPRRIMAELMGKKSGLSGGKGGSIRMFSRENRFFGGHPIPGTAATLGAGLAFASKYRASGAVCLCFFGDGTASKGRVHETFELASEWKLPMVFVIDNAVAPGSGIALGKVPSAVAELGAAFAIPGEQIDGIDVRKARKAGWHAMVRARRGEGPTILEMLTFSYRCHALPAPERTGAAEKRREDTDPIFKSRNRILENGVASERDIKAIEKDVRDAVNSAAASAKSEQSADAGDLLASVTA